MKQRAAAFTIVGLLVAVPAFPQQGAAQDRTENLDSLTANELYEAAVNLFGSGREQPTQRMLLKALEKQPNFPDALNLLGVLSDRNGLFDKSEQYFKRALELNPNNGVVSFNLGLSYMRQGRFEQAIPRFERTVEIDPSRLDAVLQAGVANLELRRFEAARVHLEAYVAAEPGNGWGQLALGEAYMALSLPLKAIAAFENATSGNGPQRAEALSHLGQVHYSLGQYDKAEQFINQSLSVEPQNATALFAKGRLRLDAGLWQQAWSLFDSVPVDHPVHREASLLSAMASSRSGDNELALKKLQVLVSRSPDYADAYYQLALVYQKLHRTEDAQQALDRFKAARSDTLGEKRN